MSSENVNKIYKFFTRKDTSTFARRMFKELTHFLIIIWRSKGYVINKIFLYNLIPSYILSDIALYTYMPTYAERMQINATVLKVII